MKPTRDWLLLIFLLLVLGLNFGAVKVGLQYSTTLVFTFYRMFVAAIVSFPIVVRSWSKIRKFDSKTLLFALLFAISSSVIFQAFWFFGESMLPAGITAVVIYTYPLFTVIFTKIFLYDKLTLVKVGGIIAGFTGIFLVLTSGRLTNTTINLYGFALLLVAAISFAMSFIIYRKWLVGFDRLALNSVQLIFAAAILFIWVIATNAHSLVTPQFTNVVFVTVLLYAAVLGTSIAYIAWMTLVDKRGPVWLSAWLFLVPVVALATSVIFLHETLDTIQFFGFIIILIGIGAVNRG